MITRCLKFILLGLFAVSVSVQATGGAASVVAEKSKTKNYTYSYKTKIRFVEDCSSGANERVCRCVIEKLEQEYSEETYWRLDADLRKNIEHPEFVAYISKSVDECDEEYANKKEGYSSGGIGDAFFSGGIATKAKGSIKIPSERDIDMGAGGGSRSAADIMKVVRQRTPGLRHIYNKFTKQRKFEGKVSLKMTIAPDGHVLGVSIVSSTTGFHEFDRAIVDAVLRWNFSKVPSGNTTVTIPFTFNE